MCGVLTIPLAVLLHFDALAVIHLGLIGDVVTTLTFGAFKCDVHPFIRRHSAQLLVNLCGSPCYMKLPHEPRAVICRCIRRTVHCGLPAETAQVSTIRTRPQSPRVWSRMAEHPIEKLLRGTSWRWMILISKLDQRKRNTKRLHH